MLRSVILAAARNKWVERRVETTPISRGLVRRFVAGTTTEDAVRTTQQLADEGLLISLDYLGEDTFNAAQAEHTKDEYLRLLSSLHAAKLTEAAEVSVKLTALGLLFDPEGAYLNAKEICDAAADAGTTVTVDMEDHTVTDSTLDIVNRLRVDHPKTGAVLQSYLRRTEADCKEFSGPGSRVRLCKGAYKEPESVAYQARLDVDRSYVRCINALMNGQGYPMLATHDPRLIEIGLDRAKWFDRSPDTYEFQMLFGIRPNEQKRLAGDGHRVRVYVPYGDEWYGYLMRRLAERPANVGFFLKGVTGKN